MKQFGPSNSIYSMELVYRLGGVDIVYLDDVTAQPLRSLRLNVTYLMYCFVSITIFIRKGEGTVNAPHLAGNLLDGTVYKITQAEEDVIYAVDFN
ncbi:hypothetical protein QQP08_010591 [Theobroma cacao]|nr:hypothetical protein QQP08_010591 [Theobroma cacao]